MSGSKVISVSTVHTAHVITFKRLFMDYIKLPDYTKLPDDAYLRDKEIYRPGPFPGGRSSWWNAVKRGEAPQPYRIGGITAWRWGDVKAYLRQLSESKEPCENQQLQQGTGVQNHG